MVKGADEMGVRGSICANDFMVGAGAPGGVRLPWAKSGVELFRTKVKSSAAPTALAAFLHNDRTIGVAGGMRMT